MLTVRKRQLGQQEADAAGGRATSFAIRTGTLPRQDQSARRLAAEQQQQTQISRLPYPLGVVHFAHNLRRT
jgi:hypothetical protein